MWKTVSLMDSNGLRPPPAGQWTGQVLKKNYLWGGTLAFLSKQGTLMDSIFEKFTNINTFRAKTNVKKEQTIGPDLFV